jgi:AraC-like DNA-binding protein
MYYIYFRLLTIDNSFSLKKHSIYLIPGLLVGTLYAVGVFLAPKAEYEVWLYDPNAYNDNPQIQFLAAMRIVGKITYLIQVVATVIGNSLLIKKYGANAEQYYSDILDGKNNNVKVLNYSIIAISVTSFILGALGRYLVLNNDWYIYLGWAIFSIVLFIIGYMGFRQKPINPTFEPESFALENQPIDLTNAAQKKILHNLQVEFEKKKIYLNSKLNIMDVVQVLGTNRTTISNLINQQYNQNFCSFVNSYRIDELARVYAENPSYTNEQLAECCGFGSLNSLKRAVAAKTGMTITEWKNQISKNAFLIL